MGRTSQLIDHSIQVEGNVMSEEIKALKFLNQLADAIEQHHGKCKVERDVFLFWLDDMGVPRPNPRFFVRG